MNNIERIESIITDIEVYVNNLLNDEQDKNKLINILKVQQLVNEMKQETGFYVGKSHDNKNLFITDRVVLCNGYEGIILGKDENGNVIVKREGREHEYHVKSKDLYSL